MTDPTVSSDPRFTGPAPSHSWTDRRVFFVVFLLLTAVFASTARWQLPYHIDAYTNALTGWHIANEGSVVMHRYEALLGEEYLGNVAWIVQSPRGPVAQYPPGAAAVATLAYLAAPVQLGPENLSGSNDPDAAPVTAMVPPVWPATLSAVLTTALALAILSVVFHRLGGTSRGAAVGGVVAGIATTAWAVASQMSWTHGPTMLWIALALLAAQRSRWTWAGLALGLALLTRPHTAAIALILGLWAAIRRRSWSPLVGLGAGSGLGLAVLISFNYYLWDRLTVSGGYSSGFTERLTDSDWFWFLRNTYGALFDLDHGLLVWAPFVALLAYGALQYRRQAPDWSVGAALGGALYLLIQLRANRFSGGSGHFAYRYPLEALVAAAPLFYFGFLNWIRPRRVQRIVTTLAFAWPVAAQAGYLLRASQTSLSLAPTGTQIPPNASINGSDNL